MRLPRPLPRLLLLAALAACSGGAPPAGAPQPDAAARRTDPNVLTGDVLGRMGSQTLLQALIGRVSTLQIGQGGGRCPTVVFRGVKTVLGDPNAAIYVDDTPAVDTCILQQIRVQDVERVEVYPSGIARTPGIHPHPYGLILVYLRGAAGA